MRRCKGPSVKLPYTGPRLWEVFVARWTKLDLERSTTEAVHQEHGTIRYQPLGIESRRVRWDPIRKGLGLDWHPRKPGKGSSCRRSEAAYPAACFAGSPGTGTRVLYPWARTQLMCAPAQPSKWAQPRHRWLLV